MSINISYLLDQHETSELNRARQRLEFLATKRKNINRMAAEEIISWDEFKELRGELEREEAALRSRIDFITRHQTLFAADFELALDIACNLGWLYEKGNMMRDACYLKPFLSDSACKKDT